MICNYNAPSVVMLITRYLTFENTQYKLDATNIKIIESITHTSRYCAVLCGRFCKSHFILLFRVIKPRKFSLKFRFGFVNFFLEIFFLIASYERIVLIISAYHYFNLLIRKAACVSRQYDLLIYCFVCFLLVYIFMFEGYIKYVQ